MAVILDQGPSDVDATTDDTPLSFPDPSLYFRHKGNLQGMNWSNYAIPSANLEGKWVVITGANNGIGREAALKFAEWGANLIIGCRQPPSKEIHPNFVVAECRALADDSGHKKSVIEWWLIDMASLESVLDFGKRWLETGRGLDILCNNAGIGSSPAGNRDKFITKDGFEIIHQVNFISHVYLTMILLPALAKEPAPRVVFTTSSFHYFGKWDLANFNGETGDLGPQGSQLYKNNKLWLQIWLTELQRRLLRSDEFRHITVNGVHPGWVNSGIWNMNDPSWIGKLVSILTRIISTLFGISNQQGSLAILNAATSAEAGPDPVIQRVGDAVGKGGGRYYNRISEIEPMPHAKDARCRLRVWQKVGEELKLDQHGLLHGLGLQY